MDSLSSPSHYRYLDRNRGADETPTWDDADHPRPRFPAPPTKPVHAIRFNPPRTRHLAPSTKPTRPTPNMIHFMGHRIAAIRHVTLYFQHIHTYFVLTYTLLTFRTHSLNVIWGTSTCICTSPFDTSTYLYHIAGSHTTLCTHVQEPQSTLSATAVK